MRLYEITLPGAHRKWETTCSIAAMEFCHSFGPVAGFRLYSKGGYKGPEIKEVRPTSPFDSDGILFHMSRQAIAG
jgi:hypothetical protein